MGKTLVLNRADTEGHACEQMVYAVVYVLYYISRPRCYKTSSLPDKNWLKVLKESGIPLIPKNAKNKNIHNWLYETYSDLDETVLLV